MTSSEDGFILIIDIIDCTGLLVFGSIVEFFYPMIQSFPMMRTIDKGRKN